MSEYERNKAVYEQGKSQAFFKALKDHCIEHGDPEKSSLPVNGRSFVFSFDETGACIIDEIEPVKSEDLDLSGTFIVGKKKH